MPERYPERDSYGRGDGRSQRGARWRDDDDAGGAQYGRSRSSRRNDMSERDDYDNDYGQRAGGYGGEYGQSMTSNYAGGYDNQRQARRWSQGQGGMRGQSYGGQYRDRGEWDRDFNAPITEYGQRGYGWGGPSANVSDELYRSAARYGRERDDRSDGGGYEGAGYGQAYQGGDQGYYGEPGRNYLTRGGRQKWGRFSGKGPKNYTRSDDRIRDDINDRLTDDPDLDASEIEVKVSNCDVILSGTVDSREDKRRAEDLADSVSGVRNVQNNLRIQAQREEEPARTTRKGGSRGENATQ